MKKRIAKKIFTTLDNYNNNNGFFIDFGREFLATESQERKNSIENINKAFEPFRKWLIIEAGYYTEHKVPNGTVREAKSISFAKMDDVEFSELYKSVFNVCWRFVLSRVFDSEQEAEEVALRMLSYT